MQQATAESNQPIETLSPDWASIPHEVLCPLCEYELRGLQNPRCPECGCTFAWDQVLDARRPQHPYLFEHHPERNWWSYRRTALGSCRPTRFWTSLHPAQKSRKGRLLLYWLIGAAMLFVVPLPFAVTGAAVKTREANTERAEMLAEAKRRYKRNVDAVKGLRDTADHLARCEDSYQASLFEIDKWYPRATFSDTLAGAYVAGSLRNIWFLAAPSIILVPLAWPWLTFLAMLVFRWTMRRVRIRRVHVLRCVLYSFDPLPLAAFCLPAAFIAALLTPADALGGWFFMSPAFLGQLCIAPLALWLILSWLRFSAAVRYYLQFDHPRGTVLATQLMVGMLILLLMPSVTYEFLRLLGIFN